MNIPEFGSVPREYNPGWFSQMTQRLRTTFQQLNAFQPILAGRILTGDDGRFPTQADLANLRSGEVYIDTSASNVLKVKP
jgi:hypothetical protein